MSEPSGLDVRIPLGAMFAVLGALLSGYGLLTDHSAELYRRSLTVNVNLWWGLVMLAFGAVLLALARRGRQASGVHPTDLSPEGIETELREEERGLEK